MTPTESSSTDGTAQIGVTGLAVMGSNIARNFAHHGYTVALHNRSVAKTDALLAEHGSEGSFVRSETIPEFLAALEKPRRVLIMVKAGDPTDAVINELADAMEEGDIIIDGGNSLYTDTIRREKAIRERGLHFVGAGISGGEEGALKGPSIMPGGPAESYKSLGPLLEEISAHVDGVPCCTHIGPDGSGHFVKMVHNGIEYSDMQLIGEAYQLLRDGLGKTAPEIADVFAEWNKGDLDSYLIEITAEVLRQTDAKTGKPLVDVIVDEAEQKGTGRWTVKSALDLGVPVTGIAEAVFARALSGSVTQRKATTGLASGTLGAKPSDVNAVHRRCQQGALRLEDHRLCPGLQPDSGRQRRIRLGHHAGRHGHHLARRLHHPGQVPQPDQGSLRRRARAGHADRRPVFP